MILLRASGSALRDVVAVPGTAELHAFRDRVRGGPGRGQIRAGAHGVEYAPARRHQVSAVQGGACVQEVARGALWEDP